MGTEKSTGADGISGRQAGSIRDNGGDRLGIVGR